ncbi:MAG: response regulator transcription factor [Anaerolineae bacterium]|nr:response regulator transcription factor [Anaerolineae bacterium]
MTGQASIFIIAPPGPWRESLLVLLQASSNVEVAGQADDGPAARLWLAAHVPAAVLLDADLPGDEAWEALQCLKRQQPSIYCLVLAHDFNQERQAQAGGADQVLMAGFSAEALFAALEKVKKTICVPS